MNGKTFWNELNVALRKNSTQ